MPSPSSSLASAVPDSVKAAAWKHGGLFGKWEDGLGPKWLTEVQACVETRYAAESKCGCSATTDCQGGGTCTGGVCVLQLCGRYDADVIGKEVKSLANTGDDRAHYWYGHYYACHAMNQVGGEQWEKYYKRMRDHLLRTQRAGGEWYDATREAAYGTAYQTAIAVLILSVPTHYLPIYQK